MHGTVSLNDLKKNKTGEPYGSPDCNALFMLFALGIFLFAGLPFRIC